MDDEVRFETQGDEFGRPPERSIGFSVIRWLIGTGIVRDEQQAQYVLIGGVVVLIVIAYFVWHSSIGSAPPTNPSLLVPPPHSTVGT